MSHPYRFRGWQLAFAASLLLSFAAAGQTAPGDTTRLRYGEEVATRAVADALRPVARQERSAWKLGLNNFLLDSRLLAPATTSSASYYTRYGVHLAYERRLDSPAWSVLGEISPALAAYRPDVGGGFQRTLSVRAQVQGRYYYNLERRRRRGRPTGNFSANYYALALGAGLGRQAHDSPFYLFANAAGHWATMDAALLYGLQRRLGRRGFVDANIGLTSLLSAAGPDLSLNGSLRVGLVLGSPPAYQPRPVPADAEASLQPRLYVEAQASYAMYQVRYAGPNPYPADVTIRTPQLYLSSTYGQNRGFQAQGYGTYNVYTGLPALQVGYYVTRRLAVQLGVQRGTYYTDHFTDLDTPQGFAGVYNGTFNSRELAVPLLLRYSLTSAFLRRWQFEAAGGLVPLWSSAEYREYVIVNQQVINQQSFGFRRTTFGLHATAGYGVAFGFGRRRRVQATAQSLLTKDLRTFFDDKNSLLQGGISLGLRYRFGYR